METIVIDLDDPNIKLNRRERRLVDHLKSKGILMDPINNNGTSATLEVNDHRSTESVPITESVTLEPTVESVPVVESAMPTESATITLTAAEYEALKSKPVETPGQKQTLAGFTQGSARVGVAAAKAPLQALGWLGGKIAKGTVSVAKAIGETTAEGYRKA